MGALHLQDPRFHVGINHDIEAVDFKAINSICGVSLQVSHNVRLNRDQRFYDNILGQGHHDLKVCTLLLESFLQHFEVPFRADFFIILRVIVIITLCLCRFARLIWVFDKLTVLLVYWKVGQMDELLLQLLWIITVLLSRKSHQAIIVHVDFQWIEAGDEDVDAQIVFEAID